MNLFNYLQKLTLLHELKTKILKIQEESSKENSPPRSALHVPQTTKMSHRRNVSFGGVVPHTDDLVQRFSVFYVGKVTISQAKAPPKFIDEMLRYIKQKEVENKRKKSSQHDRSSVEVTGNKKHSSSGKILDLYGMFFVTFLYKLFYISQPVFSVSILNFPDKIIFLPNYTL